MWLKSLRMKPRRGKWNGLIISRGDTLSEVMRKEHSTSHAQGHVPVTFISIPFILARVMD